MKFLLSPFLILFTLSPYGQRLPCEARSARTTHDAAPPSISGIARRNVPPPLQPPESDVNEGFAADYTLITANSPDCEPGLADNFPVRVQYRTASPSESQFGQWTDSLFAPIVTGQHY